jgi:predicted phage terminase large subunit-like protein
LTGFIVKTSPESGSKELRAAPLAAQAEAGNVDVLEGEWNEAFFEEANIFPNGTKDQIDAASRAFNELALGYQFDIEAMT